MDRWIDRRIDRWIVNMGDWPFLIGKEEGKTWSHDPIRNRNKEEDGRLCVFFTRKEFELSCLCEPFIMTLITVNTQFIIK